jgi:hypothetical protein
MATYFSGYATGRIYKVGQTYQRNGDTFLANADGSFTNLRSGTTFRGSRNRDVDWYFDGGSSGDKSSSKPSKPVKQVSLPTPTPPPALTGGGAGPASETVVSNVGSTPPAKSGGAGPATPVTVTKRTRSGGSLTFSGPMVPEDTQLKRVGNGDQQESYGAISDIGWAKTATGWVPVPSQDVKDRIEDNVFMEGSWFARNYVGPMSGAGGTSRPHFLDPENSHYVPYANEWRQGKPKKYEPKQRNPIYNAAEWLLQPVDRFFGYETPTGGWVK